MLSNGPPIQHTPVDAERGVNDELLSSYQFDLPEHAIAQQPTERRDGSRLLRVVRSEQGSRDLAFTDLADLLSPGDLVVVNNTQVLPARLSARKEASGGRVELLLIEPLSEGSWAALVRPSSRVRPGTRVVLERRGHLSTEVGPTLVVGDVLENGTRIVTADQMDILDAAASWGEMPLPPYIHREGGPIGADLERYQTVFAAVPGAVAAPTAGLHFSDAVLSRLRDKGVELSSVTLHVGPGTFQPVRSEYIAEHAMHSESYCVSLATADSIAACEARGGRILAVGTTVCRSLESWHRAGRPRDGKTRSTDLFLRPGHEARLQLSLLTNFHLPESTLLMLVASFLGRQRTLSLYRQAVEKGYRFFSYGDAMLIL
jgi:S-adenosylmethionine:tRNA ribosyltransferase-isomerase